MKSKDTVIRTAYGMLLLICVTQACRTKDLQSRRSRNIELKTNQISMQGVGDEKHSGKRFVLVSDSTNQRFSVTIFPLDTFNFSLTDGFTGRAGSIVVTGLTQRMTKTSDSSIVNTARKTNMDYSEKISTGSLGSTKSKDLKKKGLSISAIALAGVSVIVGLLLIRFFGNGALRRIFIN